VVLVDQLPDSAATAVVVRRAGRNAGDAILLREADATGAHLATAIGTLFKLRRKFGNSPTQNARLVVRGLKTPTAWPQELIDQADDVVRNLRTLPVSVIPGVGPGRSTTIPLTAVAASAVRA
jgi:hypothetical protein